MLNYSDKYRISTGNYHYELNRNQNKYNRNNYYINDINNITSTNINNYTSSKKGKNYFNSRSKNPGYKYNFSMNELNNIDNYNNNFFKKNINFNTNSNNKIKLTYEFENISPNEISNKTKELIDLQSQMCTLDSDIEKSKKIKKRNKTKNKKLSRSQKSLKSSILSTLTKYKTNNDNSQRNKSYNDLLNISNNKYKEYSNTNKSCINRSKSANKSMIKIWKEKCKYLDDQINKVKNNIKTVRKINSVLSKRINNVKEKEDKKYYIYDKNYRIKKYNEKLVEKLGLSEEIKKKQIELIIKMQKEINNMRLKLHMIGECCC